MAASGGDGAGVTLEILLLEGYCGGDGNLMVEMFVVWWVGCCVDGADG
jgi:hypothetical protein